MDYHGFFLAFMLILCYFPSAFSMTLLEVIHHFQSALVKNILFLVGSACKCPIRSKGKKPRALPWRWLSCISHSGSQSWAVCRWVSWRKEGVEGRSNNRCNVSSHYQFHFSFAKQHDCFTTPLHVLLMTCMKTSAQVVYYSVYKENSMSV